MAELTRRALEALSCVQRQGEKENAALLQNQGEDGPGEAPPARRDFPDCLLWATWPGLRQQETPARWRGVREVIAKCLIGGEGGVKEDLHCARHDAVNYWWGESLMCGDWEKQVVGS